jgi:hypothetical protein
VLTAASASETDTEERHWGNSQALLTGRRTP